MSATSGSFEDGISLPAIYIYVTDIKGIVECSSDHSAVNIDVSSQAHVKAALAGADMFIGGQVLSQETHKNALPFSSAYHDRETGDVAVRLPSCSMWHGL